MFQFILTKTQILKWKNFNFGLKFTKTENFDFDNFGKCCLDFGYCTFFRQERQRGNGPSSIDRIFLAIVVAAYCPCSSSSFFVNVVAVEVELPVGSIASIIIMP